MKSTTVALGLLAGMASASYNHPRHFHAPRPYYRRDNGTEPSQTTLTVQVTQVHTVTSCAPTVTNCPARNATATGNDAYATIPASDLITSEVTQVVELTTTVCPVAEASSIASSVSAAHSSGLITGTTKDVTATSDNSGATASVVTSASVGTTDVPLTYTVGPETAKSVITTTVKSTYTAQVTVTLTKSSATGASSNSPEGTTTSEGTTTTTSTSTGTRTVTISKASTATYSGAVTTGSSSAEDVTGNSASGSDSGSGSEGTCADATTVTVTAPASTVYVTVGASGAAGSTAAVATSAAPSAAPSSSATDNSATGSDAGDDEEDSSAGDECDAEDDEDDSSADDECDADDSSSSVVYATATATVVPYPVASGAPNGTYPVPTGSYRMKN